MFKPLLPLPNFAAAHRMYRVAACSVFAGLLNLAPLAMPAAHAQTAADAAKPVKILVGFPPGGSADQMARLLVDKMQTALGSPVVVENRPGAAGRLAIDQLVKSAPDGKTLLVMPSGPVVVFPHVFRKLSYDPVKDLTPVSLLARFQFGIASGKSTQATNLQDLAAKARTDKALASFGTPGNGTLPHFLGVMVADAAKVELTHVPFQGGAPSQTALLGGHVGYAIDVSSEFLERHRSGQLKLIAVTGAKRSPLMPDVPTLREQGVALDASAWFALYAPAGMAPLELQRISAAAASAVNDRAVRARMIAMGNEPVGSNPEALAAAQREDLAKWEKPIKATGFKLD